MAEWSLNFTLAAEADFKKLSLEDRKRIYQKLHWLAENYESIIHNPLTGPWQGFFKLRIGDWRVIYKTDYKRFVITVHVIGNRNKIYKRKK